MDNELHDFQFRKGTRKMMSPLSPVPWGEGPGGSEPDGAAASPLPLRRLLRFLRKYWWVPVLTFLLGAGAAIAYLRQQPPTYVSQARLWETVKLRLPEGSLFAEDMQNFLGTQSELLQSANLREMTLARLRTAGSNAIVPGTDAQPLPVKIHIRQTAKSTVFTLEARSANPGYTQAYLDALMNAYLSYKKNVRKLVSGDTLASISEQVLRLERDLKVEQDNLTRFERTNNLAILEEEATISGGYLAKLNTQLSDCRLELQILEAATHAQEAAELPDTNGPVMIASQPGGVPLPVTAPELHVALREIELLSVYREKLSRFLKPKHPRIVKLDADIERSCKLVEIYRHQTQKQLAATQQTLRMRMEAIEASIKEWQRKVMEANHLIAEANRLKLNVARVQSLYDRLQTLLQNVDISRNLDRETLAVLDQASPAIRSYQQEISVAALAVAGSLSLGIGMVLLAALRDDRFTSVIEVTSKLGDAVVGQVPEVRPERRHARVSLLAVEDSRQMYAESYRNLRSAICLMPAEGPRPKVLLVTSAAPEEGKSTIAANLARVMALGGSRVILIDGDLRKGFLHDVLGLERAPGLAEVLQNPDRLDRAIQSNCMPNLAFVGRGSDLRNPGDLLSGSALDQVLTRLRRQFDYIVIDSSPIFAADDATTLASKVDGTLFVVRSFFSRSGAVCEALGLLLQRQARVLGVVFNRANASSGSYYYYPHADQPNRKRAA